MFLLSLHRRAIRGGYAARPDSRARLRSSAFLAAGDARGPLVLGLGGHDERINRLATAGVSLAAFIKEPIAKGAAGDWEDISPVGVKNRAFCSSASPPQGTEMAGDQGRPSPIERTGGGRAPLAVRLEDLSPMDRPRDEIASEGVAVVGSMAVQVIIATGLGRGRGPTSPEGSSSQVISHLL